MPGVVRGGGGFRCSFMVRVSELRITLFFFSRKRATLVFWKQGIDGPGGVGRAWGSGTRYRVSVHEPDVDLVRGGVAPQNAGSAAAIAVTRAVDVPSRDVVTADSKQRVLDAMGEGGHPGADKLGETLTTLDSSIELRTEMGGFWVRWECLWRKRSSGRTCILTVD